jgi:hypothetical protein
MAEVRPIARNGGHGALKLCPPRTVNAQHGPTPDRGKMRLTLHTDYALRVLLYVGLKRDELATVAAIVGHFDVSKDHVIEGRPPARPAGLLADAARQERRHPARARAQRDHGRGPRSIQRRDGLRPTASNFFPIGWTQLAAVYEHGLAYARSVVFYDKTLLWQWMRLPERCNTNGGNCCG